MLWLFPVAFYSQTNGIVTKKIDCRIKYHRQGSRSNSPDDLILKELAREVLKEPWQVNLHIFVKISWNVTEKNGADTLVIRLNDLRANGDTMFRDFSLSNDLKPSSLELSFRVANRLDTTAFTTRIFVIDSVPGNGSAAFSFQLTDYNSQVDTLLPDHADFSFTKSDLERIRNRIALIHNYHASVAVLDSLALLNAQINFGKKDELLFNYFRIIEINKALNCINSSDFAKYLQLDYRDPKELDRKFREQYRSGRTNTYNFLDQLKNAVNSGEQVNLKIAGEYLTGRLMTWIERSQWMDNLQGKIYHDFLKEVLTGEPFPEENVVTLRLLEQLFPESKKDTLMTCFQKSISAIMLQKAIQLTENKRFADASLLLGCASDFNRHLNARDTTAVFLCQQKAKEGMFDSFTGIADGCISVKNYHMADIYLEEAEDFRKRNEKLVINNGYYREVYSKLFFSRNTDCDQLLGQNFYSDALNCYNDLRTSYPPEVIAWLDGSINERLEKARKGLLAETMGEVALAIQNKNSAKALELADEAKILQDSITDRTGKEVAGYDSLVPEMARLKFNKLYADAGNALEKRQFSLGLTLFNEVRQLSEDYGFTLPEEFDSLYRRDVKHFLLIRLSSAQKKIWSNQFDSAKMVLVRLNKSMTDNGLSGDPELMTACERYQQKILEQQCRNLHDSAEVRLIRAERNIALRRYTIACDLLEEASRILQKMPECNPDIKSLNDSLAKYEAPRLFQKMIREAETEIVLGEYEKAVNDLIETERIYKNQKVNRFITGTFSVPDFVTARNNPYLTLEALKKSLAEDNSRNALYYFNLLQDQGFQPKEIQKYQVILTRKFPELFIKK